MGIVAIILGALALGYGGFRYAWPDEVAHVGPVHLTVEKHENVVVAPALGAGAIIAGVGLLLLGSRRAAR